MTTGQSLTKLSINHPYVEGIGFKFLHMKDPNHFQEEIITKQEKIH